jgi:spermidine synthase
MKVLTAGEAEGRSFRVVEKTGHGSRFYYEGGVLYTHVDRSGANVLGYSSAIAAELGEPASLLLLGTAGGALATHLSRRGARVTAVHNWQTAFDTARRWFGLPANVECVKADAVEFLRSTSAQWDAFAVDVYRGAEIPDSLLAADFGSLLAKAARPGGVIVWNIADGPGSPSFKWIWRTLRRSGMNLTMVSVLNADVGNALIVCRDETDRGPPDTGPLLS